MDSRTRRIIAGLRRHYGISPRNWHTQQPPFEVLISTVLSQRTRDQSTDKAAQQLFGRYVTPKALAKAPLSAIERLVKPANFYKTKARRVKEIAIIIDSKYKGKVPKSMDELVGLPGVGRKTAGCVLVYGHRMPAIPVDVHVHRVSNRLGILKTKKPEETEAALKKAVPRSQWMLLNQLFVIHGQNICRPLSPRCGICPVNKYCNYYSSVYSVKE